MFTSTNQKTNKKQETALRAKKTAASSPSAQDSGKYRLEVP